MDIHPDYQAHLTRNKWFLLEQLPESVQPIAIQSIRDYEKASLVAKVAAARNLVKADIHACINDRGFVSRFVQHRTKLKCDNYCRKLISGNLCEFTADGTYIQYFPIQ